MASRLLICLLRSFRCFLSIGQPATVSGKVVGEGGKPLADTTVTLNGKGGVLILLDGKQTYLSGRNRPTC